jgi:p21-activated kinase 1
MIGRKGTSNSNKSSPSISSYDNKPTSLSSGFLSRTLSSKRDRSNSTSRNRPSPPLPPSVPSLSSNANTNLQMKYSIDQSSSSSGDDSPLNNLPPASAFGKARDRSTFKGVIDKFVGSFNGKLFLSSNSCF